MKVLASSLLQFGFMFIALICKSDFAPFMVLIIAILNSDKMTGFRTLVLLVFNIAN